MENSKFRPTNSGQWLNSSRVTQRVFDFLGLKTKQTGIIPGGHRNESMGHTTVVREDDRREAEEVFDRLPERYLEIFRREPYTRLEWNGRFRFAPGRALQNAAG